MVKKSFKQLSCGHVLVLVLLLALAACSKLPANGQEAAGAPPTTVLQPASSTSSTAMGVHPSLAPVQCNVPTGGVLQSLRADSRAVVRGQVGGSTYVPPVKLGEQTTPSETLYDVKVLQTYESRAIVGDTIKVSLPANLSPGEYVLFLVQLTGRYRAAQGWQGILQLQGDRLAQGCVDESKPDRPFIFVSSRTKPISDFVIEIQSLPQPAATAQ